MISKQKAHSFDLLFLRGATELLLGIAEASHKKRRLMRDRRSGTKRALHLPRRKSGDYGVGFKTERRLAGLKFRYHMITYTTIT